MCINFFFIWNTAKKSCVAYTIIRGGTLLMCVCCVALVYCCVLTELLYCPIMIFLL